MKRRLRVVKLTIKCLTRCQVCEQKGLLQHLDLDLDAVVCQVCAHELMDAEIQLRAWAQESSSEAFSIPCTPADGRRYYNAPHSSQGRQL